MMDSVFRNDIGLEDGIFPAIFEMFSRSMRYVDLSAYSGPHFSWTNIRMQTAYIR
jgi:hypothetical protein